MVLDCRDAEQPPFSKGTLVGFRRWLIDNDLDRRLIERTIEVAQERGGFGARQLRAALDSSPLIGAGRVEDSYNLMGHALQKSLGVIARQQGRGLAEVAHEMSASLVVGRSLKANLDIDWDDLDARRGALEAILTILNHVEHILEQPGHEEAAAVLKIARIVEQQDVIVDDNGAPQLRRGVAKDRRVSIEDPDMRHGRKSRSKRFDGYKRHIMRDLDSELVLAVGVTPANVPEAQVTDDIERDLEHQGLELAELHIDRAYLSSRMVRQRPEDLTIRCKAWKVRNGSRFPKTAFEMDWDRQTIRCPNHVERPFTPGKVVRFPATVCTPCPLRDQCTRSLNGRSISIHPDEALIADCRAAQATPEGRNILRQRTAVEHSLAHIQQWQGPRARYRGSRKNLFDLRRIAIVHNLHVIDRKHRGWRTHLPIDFPAAAIAA
jgi:hypothetical protein